MLFFFLIHQNLVTGGATSLQETAFPAFYDVFEEPGSQPVQWVLQLCRETISCSRSSHCHLPFADRVTAALRGQHRPKGSEHSCTQPPTPAAHSPGKAEDQPGSPPASSCAEAKSESCGCFYQTTPTRSHSSVIIKLLLLIHRFCLKKKKKGERMKCKKNKCFRKQNVGVLHVAARMTELCEAH